MFSVTEAISTSLILLEVDRGRRQSSTRQLAVVSIAAAHVFAASRDQFVDNVLFGSGSSYQQARDLGFMLVDLVHLVIPYWTLRTMRSSLTGHGSWRDVVSADEATLAGVCVVLLWLVIMLT